MAMATDQLCVPCLGRDVRLGSLYDFSSEKCYPDLTLWQKSKLKENTQVRNTISSIPYEATEDSFKKKMSLFKKMNDNVKASILSDLIVVNGATRFIHDRVSSAKQARYTIMRTSTTHVEELQTKKLGAVDCHKAHESAEVTHMVSEIQYGLDAFFIFDCEIAINEKKCDIEKQIKDLVSASLKGKKVLENDTENIRCTFYGDYSDSQQLSYTEAIKMYADFPKCNTKEKSIPKFICLISISQWIPSFQPRLHPISRNCTSKMEEMMEFLHKAEIQAEDLRKISKFSDINCQISDLSYSLDQFKQNFQEKLSDLVKKVRRSEMKEEHLLAYLNAIKKSCFGSITNELPKFLKKKDTELKKLNRMLQIITDQQEVNLYLPSEDYDIQNLIDEKRFVVCFAFNITSAESPFIKKLEEFLSSGQILAYSEKEWIDSPELSNMLDQKFNKYICFVKNNFDNKNTAFVITDKNQEFDAGPVISLYDMGQEIDFEPPGQPGQPSFEKIGHNFVSLVWTASKIGAEFITYYSISYRIESKKTAWLKVKTSGKLENIRIDGLTPNSLYHFKIEAVSEPGISQSSAVSEISTPCSRAADHLIKESKQLPNDTSDKQNEPQLTAYQPKINVTMKDDLNLLCKCSIAHRKIHKPMKTIMVVGATGAGKTTLINGIANFLFGVMWEDKFRFKIITDESVSQTKSQTKYITAYTLYETNQLYDVTVVDTPGFGDTGGLENDKKLVIQIRKFFSQRGKNGIDHLHGICFVAQSSLPRLTTSQRYIFDETLKIFGKDVKNNIFIMVTFADASDPPVLQAIKEAEVPSEIYFKFNNSALFESDTQGEVMKSLFWKMGNTSFHKFFDHISKIRPQSLALTKEVLEERQRLEELIPELHQHVKLSMSQLKVIEQEKQILSDREAAIEANEKFTYNVLVSKHKKENAPPGIFTTNCRTCSTTCHKTCIYNKDEDKDKCCMMTNGKCTFCPHECPWQDHSNTPYYFIHYEEQEERTDQDLKKKYDLAQSGKFSAQSLIENAQEVFRSTQYETYLLTEKIWVAVKRLDDIALRPNSLSEIDYIELLIEGEKREKNAGWKDRIRHYQDLIEQSAEFKEIKEQSFLLNGKDRISQIGNWLKDRYKQYF